MTQTKTTEEATIGTDHLDVLIVGAGISGIDAGHHLQEGFPEKSFAILEAQSNFGGTWRTHRYPGVRSDSDLYTFGYDFKAWTGNPIASGEEILKYLDEVIHESNLEEKIHYNHHITKASWSRSEQRWTLEGFQTESGEAFRVSANFLWMCQGYYRHAEGYTPEWPGMDRFEGEIIHPQRWPHDLSLEGKKVIVIGSGATAATLVPAIAEQSDHVTMLQRSPTYFWAGPNSNETADLLRQLDIPEAWIHEIVRRKILFDQELLTRFALDEPEFAKTELINAVRALLPEGFDVDRHFTPRYDPWRQRVAFVPNGDLFTAISSGKVSMLSDEIESFTQSGLSTKTGVDVDADIIITATGFNLSVLGDISFFLDDSPIDFADTVTYRGLMFTGVPNMAWVFGYFRASWTLRADLVSDFLCAMFTYMDELGASSVTPALRAEDRSMPILPWVNTEDFNPGYLMRSMDLMPRRGDKPEWQHSQDYWAERELFAQARFDDGCLVFTSNDGRVLREDQQA